MANLIPEEYLVELAHNQTKIGWPLLDSEIRRGIPTVISQYQKQVIIQVVNVFETSKLEGNYSEVVVRKDGKNKSRQISYGRSQSAEQTSLKSLTEMYVNRRGKYEAELRPFLPKIGTVPLAEDEIFKSLLKRSANEDPLMRKVQDDFFDQRYYQRAMRFFNENQFICALSLLVIYDSYIQSGGVLKFLRNRFTERTPFNGGDDKTWIKAYVDTRHRWLSTHTNPILRQTIYRTQCFLDQINRDNWDLSNPFVVQGIQIPTRS